MWTHPDARRQTYILHDTLSLLYLADKVVFLCLDFRAGLLTHSRLVIRVEATALHLAALGRLGAVEHESAVLDIATSLGGELNVRIECRLPSSQEASLDLLVLSQAGLADLFFGESIFFQSLRERLLGATGRVLGQEMG